MMWRFDGKRIAIAREASDVTQEQLAAMAGITQNQISQWELGEVKPGQDSLMKICNALKTPPRFFFVQSGNNGNVEINRAAA